MAKEQKETNLKVDSHDEKREQILMGAEKLFTRYGYLKTTMDDIAEIAGLKKASLYYYYNSKDAIFRDVIMKEINNFIIEAKNKIDSINDPIEKVLSFCFYRLDYFQQFINLHNLSIHIIKEAEPYIKKLHKDFIQREINYLKSLLDEGVKLKIFKNCDTEKIATLILDINDALKFKEFRKGELKFLSDIDYPKLKNDIKNIMYLILEGLKN